MPKHDLSSIDPAGAIALTVGWRSGTKLRLAQIALGAKVAAEFRDLVALTLEDMADRTPEPWTPDAELSPETYLTITTDLLGQAPILHADHEDLTLSEAVLAPEALPMLHPADLPARDLELYAITVGDTPGSRAAFLRRSNPRRGLRAGRVLTSYSDVLVKIEDPIFGFDLIVDLVFVGDDVHVLSPNTFSRLFRDQEALAAQVPSWTGVIADAVPMSAEGRERLQERALRDGRLSRRLEAIASRGHLPGITAAELRETMTAVGLNPDELLDDQGQLVLQDEHIPQVLYFLNEDLFYGALTSTGFRADRKAVR